MADVQAGRIIHTPGVARASANFSGRGLSDNQSDASGTSVPVHAFFGAHDKRLMGLQYQWTLGRTLAQRRGFHKLTRTIVRGAGHSPFPREVLSYFADVIRTT
jgi:dienelactone hydrolase